MGECGYREMSSGGIALDRGGRPSIINVQAHHASRIPGSSDGNQIDTRPRLTKDAIADLRTSPLDSPLLQARGTSSVQMQRSRYLTTPQSAHERPKIVCGPEYKWNNSVEYKSQAVHHEAANNCRPAAYTEQLEQGFKADRRRVPVPEVAPRIKDAYHKQLSEVRERIDPLLYEAEVELKAAQDAGDMYKMNICRDQILQLEKQYLYEKKNTMKLMIDKELGNSETKARMERDWYKSWGDFREEVEEEKKQLNDKHKTEMQQFKQEVFNVAKTASQLQVSDQVHQMRKEVSDLVQAGRIEEAAAKRKQANDQAFADLQGQSPLEMLRTKCLEQRMAALALQQRKENQDFENKVQDKARGLAAWRCGFEQVDR